MNTIKKIKNHPTAADLQIATLDNGCHCVVPGNMFAEGDIVKFTPVRSINEGFDCEGLISLADDETYEEFDDGFLDDAEEDGKNWAEE